MGFRCSLIAAKALPRDRLLEFYGFEVTGRRAEISEFGFSFVQASDDWVLLIADGMDRWRTFSEEHAERLSSEATTLFFFCETYFMATELVAFQNDKLLWSIRYNGSEGVSTPKILGDVPDFVERLLRERREDQDAEDEADERYTADYMYEVTFDTLMRLTGQRPDQPSDLEDPEPFQELRRIQKDPEFLEDVGRIEQDTSSTESGTRRVSLFGRLFGKR